MSAEQETYKPMSTEERLKKRKLANRMMDSLEKHVFICDGICCVRKGNAPEVIAAFREELKETGMAHRIKLSEVKCLSRCADAGSMVVYPEGVWYQGVSTDDVKEIVQQHFIEGRPIEERIAYSRSEEGKFVRSPLFPSDEYIV
ncbi:ferredoxin [Paenibacillus sp. NPDC057967]|uniref:(2Fe-2S) ferredoxin domain-containing protein n=1 Tax=Paenibacillus sp. NPDC057967 TaxID=3346293 RepID=UPI0036DB5C18